MRACLLHIAREHFSVFHFLSLFDINLFCPGGKSPSLVQGMGEEEEVVGGFGPDGSSSGFYGSSRSSPRSHNSQNFDPTNGERFSRKVFVGGLPPDIDEGKG